MGVRRAAGCVCAYMSVVVCAVVCAALLMLTAAVPALADMGPKPTVIVTVKGLPEGECYGTLLSQTDSTGPESAYESSGYKQLSEGYEDARSFVIMQQVGMTEPEVQSSIRSQISLVFFLPLLAAACHTAGAFPMTRRILLLFGLSNTGLFVLCSGLTLLIFALVYYGIYRLTAREYYRIVRR